MVREFEFGKKKRKKRPMWSNELSLSLLSNIWAPFLTLHNITHLRRRKRVREGIEGQEGSIYEGGSK